jgi:hypothetical protein
VRDKWTDERLDDLNHRVDLGFNEVGADIRDRRHEIRSESRALRLEMATEFAAVRSEMAAMHRTTMQTILGGFAVMLVGFMGTIATVLTQR